ncbi:MAG: hpch/hpai aldolase, partial [Desulfobacterales bacterium]|nr:hpch/hpai aldolase [Desulfobacterales bacterium]
REVKIGHYVGEFTTTGIGQILKAAGCDFALLDMEHSGFSFDTVKSVLRYMQAADLPSIVRVPSKEGHHISRACDVGAEGLMLPMVNSAEEAKDILEWMKYFPEGRRGVALQIAHDRYQPGPVLEKLAAANKWTTLIVLIETADGVENADAIAALDGVDCLWVGHMDLSWSLGMPGQLEHSTFTRAIEQVVDACKRHNKSLGRLVPTVHEGVELFERGFDFICYSGDIWVLYNAVREAVTDLRARCEKRSRGQNRPGGEP